MRCWFLPSSRDVSEGDPFKDVYSPEQPHPVTPPLHLPPLSLHHTKKENMNVAIGQLLSDGGMDLKNVVSI